MKRRRFRAANCRGGCLLAKAFGVSAANFRVSALGARRGAPVAISTGEGKMEVGRQASRLSGSKDDRRDAYLPNDLGHRHVGSGPIENRNSAIQSPALCLAEIDALLERSRFRR